MLYSENPVHDDEARKIALHVNFDDAASLNFVLNNAENIFQYYRDKGNALETRIITHGPGLHMLREDTSPVKERINNLGIHPTLHPVNNYIHSW
jgi:intracellular sulfur oxidation DsrE/DsrF family protein